VRWLALTAFLCAAPAVRSAEGDGLGRVELKVGETIELEVGNALGWFCDAPSLVSAQIVSYDGYNAWVVTGVAEGATVCRVGTTVGRASYLFEVVVGP
jgi:hypothetical protein